jgi:hypothetical protein
MKPDPGDSVGNQIDDVQLGVGYEEDISKQAPI